MKRQPRAYRAGNRVGQWIGGTLAAAMFIGGSAAIAYGFVALVTAL